MINRVPPAAPPSNREPQERRHVPLRHRPPRAFSEVEAHPTRQSSAEPCRDAEPSYTSEGRQAKIAQLKRAVASGTYRADAEQIAEKLVSEALVDILA